MSMQKNAAEASSKPVFHPTSKPVDALSTAKRLSVFDPTEARI
jgi:hypothetical protein